MQFLLHNRYTACLFRPAFASLALLFSITTTQANSVTFADTTGDGIARGDISMVTLNFDTITGDFTATWTATPANPFNGDFRLNLNIQNTSIVQPLVSISKIFSSVAPSLTMSISGTAHPLLQAWSPGDTIISQSPRTFSSQLVDMGDTSMRETVEQARSVVISVPDAGVSAAMLGIALLGTSGLTRMRRQR